MVLVNEELEKQSQTQIQTQTQTHPQVQDEEEPNYEEKAKTYETFGNLEGFKRAFFNKDYETATNELNAKPYLYFLAKYKYGNDNDGRPDFIAKNLNTGFVKELEDVRKYFTVCFRCYLVDSEEKKYSYTSYWVVNTPSMKEILGSRYDDYEWVQVMNDNNEDFIRIMKQKDGEDNVISEKYLH